MGSKINVLPNEFKKYMPNPLNKSILLSETTEEEISKIIDSLHNKNSAGHDLVSQKLLKRLKRELVPIIMNLINASINDSFYPDCLKIAKVIPIYKKGSREQCNNYRPISLLSTFNKIFEKKYIMIYLIS